MSESERLRSVAWAREPGEWTLAHLTLDGERTLCGLSIPEEDGRHRVAFGVEARACERCAERGRELEPNLADRVEGTD